MSSSTSISLDEHGSNPPTLSEQAQIRRALGINGQDGLVPEGQLPGDLQRTGERGQPGGYAELDDAGRVPATQLPDDSGGSDRNYVHEQFVAADEWVIQHNMGKRPNLQIWDTSGAACVGSVVFESDNLIRVSFSAAFAGVAYLN